MTFSTLSFLGLFLPGSLVLYYLPWQKIATQRALMVRKLILVFLSLIFYVLADFKHLLLLISSILVNYLGLRLARRFSRLKNPLVMGLIILNLAVLIAYKYFLAQFPLGLSFYSFKLLIVLGDELKAEAEAEGPLSLLDFATYISFFPEISAGPITRAQDFIPQLDEIELKVEQLALGLSRFIFALTAKLVVADSLFSWRQELLASGVASLSVLDAWQAAVIYVLYIYLDFATYSAMAIGLSQCLGFEIKENFNLPYAATSLTDFWRRWHISLSSFFRDYVYIPLGGNRKGTARQVFNLLIVWLLTGIWHGSSLNFLFWGLFNFLFLVLEKFALASVLKKLPRFCQILYTLLVVLVGFIFFSFTDLGELQIYFTQLFKFSGDLLGQSIYHLLNNLIVLVLALVLCTSLPQRLRHFSEQPKTKLQEFLLSLFLLFCLVLAVIYIINQGFVSFLYVQF